MKIYYNFRKLKFLKVEIMMKEKITFFNTIMIAIIKEMRLERNIHQAVLADICGKTISAWSKIEKGKSPMSLELFCKICNTLRVQPSLVMITLERYADVLAQNGYIILTEIQNEQPDTLLEKLDKYYSSEEFKNRQLNFTHYNWNISILNTPYYDINGNLILNNAFRYIIQNAHTQYIEK